MKKICPKCGVEISTQNYSRHLKKCDGTGLRTYIKKVLETLNCRYCNKLCKNANSLTQHEIRCSQNPDRKNYDNLKDYAGITKGLTKETSEVVKKQSETMKQKYKDGYVSPQQGTTRKNLSYVYKQHNDSEIEKWLNYIQQLNIEISPVKVWEYNNYKYITTSKTNSNEFTINLTFEHDYVANVLLNGKLKKENTVHHIDYNGLNNDKYNLLVFETNDEHKRFHNSKFAYLNYNEETHLFNCMLKKDGNKNKVI